MGISEISSRNKRAAFRLAEESFAIGMRAGKRAFDGTEQFALDQFARQRGAIDLDDPAPCCAGSGHGSDRR